MTPEIGSELRDSKIQNKRWEFGGKYTEGGFDKARTFGFESCVLEHFDLSVCRG